MPERASSLHGRILGNMKALIIKKPGEVVVESVAEPVVSEDRLLLKVRRIGLCGSDLNSFRGKNPMVSFPRIPGHEVAATDRKSTRLNSSHRCISYAVFCLKK